MDVAKIVEKYREQIIGIRRDLHRIPEPAFTEEKTSAYVADYLKKLGFAVDTGIAKTGVVSLLESGTPGKTLMLRSDLDALRITEDTGLPFASTHDGAMHACGHDGHMAMLLGAAMAIREFKTDLKGNIKFVFQPAEEGPGGAKPMIEAGVLDNPKVDYALGCHLWPALREGTVGVKAGNLMAAMDRFDVKIIGKGGHASMPHLCVDSLEVAVQVINALQRIVSRQMNPLYPAVVTVASFHAGDQYNAIPAEAVFSGTTRTFDREVWESWEGRIEKIISGVCQSMGAEYELTYTRGYPPTINDREVSEVVRRCAEAVVGPEKVLEPQPTLAGEDMAFFLERSQGCFFFLGTGREGGFPLHNSKFNFNEDVLLKGVEVLCNAALELLR